MLPLPLPLLFSREEDDGVRAGERIGLLPRLSEGLGRALLPPLLFPLLLTLAFLALSV
jgi:hypothetical protein